MANNKHGDEMFELLRERGVRKKVAKSVARLESDGADGKDLARKAVDDLDAAAAEIRKRVLHTSPRGGRRARTPSSTRPRKATKRKATAKSTARTRTRARGSRTRAR
jgi:hypothetical protein